MELGRIPRSMNGAGPARSEPSPPNRPARVAGNPDARRRLVAMVLLDLNPNDASTKTDQKNTDLIHLRPPMQRHCCRGSMRRVPSIYLLPVKWGFCFAVQMPECP